jgi:hypothetical protein
MPKLPPLEIHGTYPDPPTLQLNLGDFAGVRSSGGVFGRIFMIKSKFDHRGDLYHLRTYDVDTGYPMICPDNRCDFSRVGLVGTPTGTIPMAQAWPPRGQGCVICTMTGSRDTFSKYSDHDVAFFRKDGMINGD